MSYHYNTSYNIVPIAKNTSDLIATFVAVFAFSVGTGGMLTPHSLERLNAQRYAPEIHIEQRVNKLDIRAPAEHMALIRDVFSLNASDLAAILNISRPTVYAWLDGQEPKPEKIPYIQQLSQAAEKMKALNIVRIDTLVRRPIFDGSSFLDKLKNNENITPYLETIKKLSDKEANARYIQKQSKNKNVLSISEAANSYSIPLYSKS